MQGMRKRKANISKTYHTDLGLTIVDAIEKVGCDVVHG